jgi:hypothetical protein
VTSVELDLSVTRPADKVSEPAAAEDSDWKLTWETVLGIIGAVAAIGVWINVVAWPTASGSTRSGRPLQLGEARPVGGSSGMNGSAWGLKGGVTT